MRFRKLRIAWSVAWGVAAMLLCVLWMRSYEHFDSYVCHERFGILFANGSAAVTIGAETDFDLLIEQIVLTVPPEEPHRPSFQLDDTGVRAPLWFAEIVFAFVAAAPWLRWRFSLRTLLIATTVVAVVLGLVTWLRPRIN